MVSPSCSCEYIRKLARNTLVFVLVFLLAFGGFRPGQVRLAYADEGNRSSTAQATAKPFMDAPSKKPDFPSLTATNWMSGLDNGRYLSEVNIPGAHDACTQHMLQAMSELKAIGQPYAECQDMQYQDMLNNGVRILDLRLNNWYLIDLALPAWAEILIFLYGLPAWLVERIIEWIIETTDANKGDDGKNCYMVHGDNSWGRTFWASKDADDGNYITLNNVLDTCKGFLSEHPSETIVLYLADETTDSDQISLIRARAKGILEGFANEINPATGEPYLYMEGGKFAKYTTMPKVGDVRGKVVIASNSSDDFGVGMSKSSAPGYEPGTTLTYNEENHYDVGSSDKQTYLQDFFNDHVGEGIPRNLRTHLDHMNSIYTSSNRIFMESPRIIADEINPYVYTGSSALIQGMGTYYGWVLSDCVSNTTAEPVWRSNFPDDLEYCTVTVKTGNTGGAFTSPDQTYAVLKGSQFNFPGDIYADLHGSEVSLTAWEAGGKAYSEGDAFTVEGDVTITATWDQQAQIPVELTWEDSNNNDEIRPSLVYVSLARNDGKCHYDLGITEETGWKRTADVYVPMGKKAADVYSLSVVHDQVITGKDTPTSYADAVSTTQGGGFNVTLKHTMNLYTMRSSIAWDDEGDKDGARSSIAIAYVKDNGEEVDAEVVTPEDVDPQDPNKWNVSFEGIPLKRANGEVINYTVDCYLFDPYNLYTKQDATGTATDYVTIRNTHTPNMVSPTCTVNWEDTGDADRYRPDSVTLRLMADGEEAERHELDTSDKTKSTFEQKFEDQKRYHYGMPIRYTLNQNRIDHYSTGIAGNAERHFTVTNRHTLDKTSVSTAAHWLDANNQDGKRPESLTIRLYADGADTGKTLELSDDNDWVGCFDELDIHRADGGEIEYTVEAESFEHEDDYTLTTYGDSDVGYDLVLEHETEKVSLEGVVEWDDAHNQDGVRPSAVRLVARQAGATVLACNVEGEASQDEWAWETQSLPAYMPGRQGELLTYAVAAADAIGYDAPVARQSENGRWVVTYHRDPQTVSIAGLVGWDDDDNRDAIRPDSVGVMLWRDGKAYMGTRVASAEGGWTFDFSKMPRYEGEGDEKREIQYSVTASKVEGYDWSAEGFELTYTHAPAMTSTHVMQVWNDSDNADGLRLDSVEVSLYANDTPTGKSLTLSADNDWASEFDAMPKYDQGKPIAYTVEVEGGAAEELRNRGYTVDLVSYGENDWSIVATRAPDTVTVRGTVVWDDWNNADGLRPQSVVVHAQGTGSAGAMVSVTAGPDGTWIWEMGDLQKRSGGTQIAYAISEDAVDNYTTEITGSAEDGYTITNRLADHSYAFAEGGDGSWTRGSKDTLGFTVKRSRNDETTFGHFAGVQVDGKDVPKDAYEAQAGSVVIKLKPAYLEGLSDGSHTIVATFDDGSAQSSFTVRAAFVPNAPSSPSGSANRLLPNTSDSLFDSAPLFLLAACAALCLAIRCRLRVALFGWRRL